jgi:DNA topoisomerase I
MSKLENSYLVIVESPAKCIKIQHILQDYYKDKKITVKATKGHIEQIKTDDLYIDLETFEPVYEFIPKDNLKTLITESKKCKYIYLATDLDYAGEFIAFSVCKLLHLDIKTTPRMIFNSITKDAIIKSFENPTFLDLNHVKYEKTRQIIDKIIGYKLSPLAYKSLCTNNNSIGRCQTAALRLLVDHEKEIEDKIKNNNDLHYEITGKWSFENIQNINCYNKTKNITKTTIMNFIKYFDNKMFNDDDFFIININSKIIKIKPSIPFITSTLQQEVGNKLNISVKNCMNTIQNLYEDGLITYIRTDCPNISPEFKKIIKGYILKNYGPKYLSKEDRNIKLEHSQNGHEAIRITNVELDNIDNIDKYENNNYAKKIYKLIYHNTIASLMTEQLLNSHVFTIFIKNNENIILESTLNEEIFNGFKIIYEKENNYVQKSKIEYLKNYLNKNKIINIKMNEILITEDLNSIPLHYKEPTLVKKLEELGIGRPSTYAYIINIIQEREYVENKNVDGITKKINNWVIKNKNNFYKIKNEEKDKTFFKENSKLIPTYKGNELINFVKNNFDYIIDYNYTSNMEKELENIANGNKNDKKVLQEFWNNLKQKIDDYDKKHEINKKQLFTNNEKIVKYKNIEIPVKKSKYGVYIEYNGHCFTVKRINEIEEITMDMIVETINKNYKFFKNDNIEVFSIKKGFCCKSLDNLDKIYYFNDKFKNIDLITLKDCKELINHHDYNIGSYQNNDIIIKKSNYGSNYYFIFNDKTYVLTLKEYENKEDLLNICINKINTNQDTGFIKKIQITPKKYYKLYKSNKYDNNYYFIIFLNDKKIKTTTINKKDLEDIEYDFDKINDNFIKNRKYY